MTESPDTSVPTPTLIGVSNGSRMLLDPVIDGRRALGFMGGSAQRVRAHVVSKPASRDGLATPVREVRLVRLSEREDKGGEAS